MSTLQINKSKHQSLKLAGSNFVIPLMATVGLFAGGVVFLNPLSFVDNSYADSTNVDVSVNIGEMIMLPEVSQEAINLALDPDVNGDFESASVNVRVSTNHVSGYTLTMSTEGTETALTSSDFDSYKIDTLSSKTSATNFADLTHTDSINKWGYATDNNGTGEGQTEENYYYGITNKDNPATIKITDAPTSSSETNVTFATKGKDLAAGTYSNTVVFSAVGNAAPETRTLADINTMQEASAAICANTSPYSESNETYTLTDSRDNSTYQVRKLIDNNCWMVSDLTLGSTSPIELNGATTDLSNTNDTFTLPAFSDEKPPSAASSTLPSVHKITDGGVSYNWIAATTITDYDTIERTTEAPASICPKQWHLPSYNAWKNVFNLYGYSEYMMDSVIESGPLAWKLYNYGSYPQAIYWTSTSAYDDDYFVTAASFDYEMDGLVGWEIADAGATHGTIRCILTNE